MTAHHIEYINMKVKVSTFFSNRFYTSFSFFFSIFLSFTLHFFIFQDESNIPSNKFLSPKMFFYAVDDIIDYEQYFLKFNMFPQLRN